MVRALFSMLMPAALLLAGCSVGPNYHPAQTAVPDQWSEVGPGGTSTRTVPLAQWWTNFNDPLLDSLIERSVESNHDLKAAEARLRAGRALHGSVLFDFFPTVDMNASYTRARRSQKALAFPVRLIDTDTYQAGFDASWELDVFGGKRRSLEAYNADLQALEEDHRTVLVSVMSEVARNYIELRSTQRRLELAHKNVQSQQETVN